MSCCSPGGPDQRGASQSGIFSSSLEPFFCFFDFTDPALYCEPPDEVFLNLNGVYCAEFNL
jgi:hypothetical protein